jgi:exopolyphosphatase/guanosine-5'-triphosphate,3'-diphosphate pyrophosphatase
MVRRPRAQPDGGTEPLAGPRAAGRSSALDDRPSGYPPAMRISVVDVGSNTVRLAVADAEDGVPLPVHTAKWRLRLSDQVQPGGPVPDQAVERLVDAVAEASRTATRWGAAGPLAFATAVVRNAPNREEVLRTVRARTGVELCTLPGEVEAELTFLGARRWMGWRSGPLALMDIGGGSLEVAFGRGRVPDFVASLPLGAGRLTHEFFEGQDPPLPEQVRALRRKVRHQLRDAAAPGRHGPFVERRLHREDLRDAVVRLAALPAADRALLPGISAPRAAQSLAGAVVGHTAMKLTGIRTLTLCPWAIREGVLLRHIEDGPSWWAEITRRNEAVPQDPVPLRIATATS